MSQLSRIALIIAMNVLLYVLAVERYTNEFDNIDIDAILRNDTLRDEYHKCYINTGPCNTIAQKKITGIYVYDTTIQYVLYSMYCIELFFFLLREKISF